MKDGRRACSELPSTAVGQTAAICASAVSRSPHGCSLERSPVTVVSGVRAVDGASERSSKTFPLPIRDRPAKLVYISSSCLICANKITRLYFPCRAIAEEAS